MNITKFVLAFVTLLFLHDAAFACRCLPRKPSADISRSVAVFSGKVIKVTFKPPYEVGRTVTFEVERVWKGETKKKITLITRMTSCDVRFREGASYLVFASMLYDGSGLTTHQCSGTGLVVDRKQYLKLLGEGKIPEESRT